ncbi:GntR family transcriptional regulator [Bacillus sp. CECT 9360]|uniref:GntR family transcriptional regulator n=1 Tax=Bacillus sp. CECT 9360 TaxID=2845821 RepID=UPI001E5356FD|nr:GntR family transcriptional regulator [Bacillus sp. CECT 9360]CAH0344326.1 HTH-type transcriptional repressor YtrA [Bacillus sp. CECT 9360]
MNVNFNNRDPLYLQVVRYFKEQIAIGQLEAGQEIPSRRELASMLKINPNTAQKAYKEMEEQGLIHTERNFPSRITTDEQILNSIREELIMQAVEIFITSIKPINVSLDELVAMVKEKYTSEKKNGGDQP